MKFFDPQIQLGKEAGELADRYFIHVVTFCPYTNFCADGFSIDDSQLAAGLLSVVLKLREDPQIPKYEFITPIVHGILVEDLDFPAEDFQIEVAVEGEVVEEQNLLERAIDPKAKPKTTTKTGGKGAMSTKQATASTGVRPTDDPTLFGYCR